MIKIRFTQGTSQDEIKRVLSAIPQTIQADVLIGPPAPRKPKKDIVAVMRWTQKTGKRFFRRTKEEMASGLSIPMCVSRRLAKMGK